MESANLSGPNDQALFSANNQGIRVREATREDLTLIDHLSTYAAFRHRHADWFSLSEWIEKPACLIANHPNNNQGALIMTADPGPAAWIRFLAVERTGLRQRETIDLMLALFERGEVLLRSAGITQIGWMTQTRWADYLLGDLGFYQLSTMITFGKDEFDLPPSSFPFHNELIIRPAFPEDMRQLAALEQETYDPLWRQSARGLHYGWRESSSFDLAIYKGKIVGFQHSTRHETTAHLARLTVSPHMQGQGIGSALLRHAIRGYQRAGMSNMTLNTQSDNSGAQRLYRRFGYAPTGFNIPLWVKDL